MLLTAHNLTYYQDVMAELRAAIPKGETARVADRVAQIYARDN
jgi:queuine/archaeosine tRNA-ribosyltransferase